MLLQRFTIIKMIHLLSECNFLKPVVTLLKQMHGESFDKAIPREFWVVLYCKYYIITMQVHNAACCIPRQFKNVQYSR